VGWLRRSFAYVRAALRCRTPPPPPPPPSTPPLRICILVRYTLADAVVQPGGTARDLMRSLGVDDTAVTDLSLHGRRLDHETPLHAAGVRNGDTLVLVLASPAKDAPLGGGSSRGMELQVPPEALIGISVVVPFPYKSTATTTARTRSRYYHGFVTSVAYSNDGPTWQVHFPEDNDSRTFTWTSECIQSSLRAGILLAEELAAGWGGALLRLSAEHLRSLPDTPGRLNEQLAALGGRRVRVDGNGDCAFGSVGFALRHPNAARSPSGAPSGSYRTPHVRRMRDDVRAFLDSSAATAWRLMYGEQEWRKMTSVVSASRGWVGSCALRAMAIIHKRDIILLNGLPGSTACVPTVFYSDSAWTGASVLYDVCHDFGRLMSWLHGDGIAISPGAPSHPCAAPIFVVYNGVNHFDAVELLQQQTPPPTPPPAAADQLLIRIAHHARAAAMAVRSSGLAPAQQHSAAVTAATSCAATFGAVMERMPCFMCGASFERLKTHWALRSNKAGASSGSLCASAWTAPAAELPLAECFGSASDVPADAAATAATACCAAEEHVTASSRRKRGPRRTRGDDPAGDEDGGDSSPDDKDTSQLPWEFALDLLQHGDINGLPRVYTIKDVPHYVRRDNAKALKIIFARLRQDAHDSAANAVLHLYARWVLRRDRYTGSARGKQAPPSASCGPYDTLRRRIDKFIGGDWQGLHAAFLDSARTHAAAQPRVPTLLRAQERACEKAGENALSRAVQCIVDTAGVVERADEALSVLTPLHPPGGFVTDDERATVQRWLSESTSVYSASEDDISWALRSAPKGSAPGPSGWRMRHWQRAVLEDKGLLVQFTAFLNGAFASGTLDPQLRQLWGSCLTIALKKPRTGHRPISMGNVERRLLGRAALHAHRQAIQDRFRGVDGCTNLQLGCMAPNASETVIHDLTLHMERNPSHILCHIDAANAFNSQKRFAFLQEVHTHFPALLPLAAQFYLHESDLLIWGNKHQELRRLKSRSGQQQGDTLGPFLFCLGIHPVLERAHAAFPNVLIRAICDDIHLAGPDADVAAAFNLIRKGLADMHLTLSYGAEKTCCWSPSFEAAPASVAAAARAACSLPTEVLRLSGGMPVLGSFIGTDDYVSTMALALVDNPDKSKSVHHAAAAVVALARSEVRNSRDIAGALLRSCIVPKVSYLCRTVRPDLLLRAATRADEILADAFCAIYDISTSVFRVSAPAAHRLAAARVRLPTSLAGCGLRSAVNTSAAAYLAAWRSAAPAIHASAALDTRDALANINAQSPAPALRAVAAAAEQLTPLLPDAERPALALPTFCSKASPHVQRKLTHALEQDLFDRAVADAQPDVTMRAFLNSCDGRWIRVARLPFLQLSNSETITRMQRYLRLPISTLVGVVGRKSLGKAEAIVDPLGDVYLSGYKAPEDDEWRQLHNAVCRNISSFASQAYVSNTLEGGKGKQKGSKKRPGDIRLKGDSGAHGWVAAGNRETWCDVTIKSAVCVTYAPLAAAARGGCAAAGAQEKMRKYRDDIPDTAHFLPLPMESEGFISDSIEQLLLGFAHKRAARREASADDARRWHSYWLDNLATTHARYLARCINNRATANLDAADPSKRRLTLLDADDAYLAPPPRAAPAARA
jgi:hypothetical protein